MLTEATIRAAKPREKPYKLKDERGLYLLITPAGGRLWRLRYRMHGRETMMGLGAYPDVGLKDARERREEARRDIAAGRDPTMARRARREGRENTFGALAEEWLKKRSDLGESARSATESIFRIHVNPWIGGKPITAVTVVDVREILKRMDGKDLGESTRRAKRRISSVLRYAISEGLAAHDVTADLLESIAATPTDHHAAIIEPATVGRLMAMLDDYPGQPSTRYALRLLPHVFLRSKELRRGRWEEINTEAAEWRVPRGNMKMREYHLVPLSRQALAIIAELREITGRGPWMFPGLTGQERPMSRSGLLLALRRIGFSGEEHTIHGFRTTASTLLNELGWPVDAIELQLAHRERRKSRAAYNRAQHLPLRRQMMQAWADYLDCLKRGDIPGALLAGAYRTKP